MNSPLFALTSSIRSIRQALLFFGETELRKWIALATLASTADDKPSELIRHSLVRARFCESVARLAKNGLEQSAFLTGLFSLLDALIDRPLEETLSEMSLAPEIAAVLRGGAAGNDPLAGIYQLATSLRGRRMAARRRDRPAARDGRGQPGRGLLRGGRLGAAGFGTHQGRPAGIDIP